MGMIGAIVGFGQVAEKAHLPGFAARGHRIAAVCDGSAQRLQAARRLLPEAKVYSSLEEMLSAEPSVEFVDIATPPYLHGAQATTALKAGKHVLCEKPLAFLPEEVETVRRTALMAGKTAFTVHNWAYSPQWLKVYELCAQLGPLRHAELSALRTKPAAGALPGDWRREAAQAGGGILVDHGWHNLYLLYRLVRAMPQRASGRLDMGAVDEEAAVFLEFPKASGFLHLSWKAPLRSNGARLVCENGLLELRDDHIALHAEGRQQRFDFPEALSAGSAHPEWFTAMLPDFEAEAAGEGRGRNLEEASFCASVIHRLYQAHRYGRNPLRAALRAGERARDGA